MQQIEKQLKEWRDSRNIKIFPLTIKEDLLKELEEVKQAKENLDLNNYVEELADIAIFCFNGIGLLGIKYVSKKSCVLSSVAQIESYINNLRLGLEFPIQIHTILSTLITSCEELVTAKQYDFKKVVLEKIKVLNSRQQCLNQKKHWELHGAFGKWEKMKDQPKDTLYIGNYGKYKV